MHFHSGHRGGGVWPGLVALCVLLSLLPPSAAQTTLALGEHFSTSLTLADGNALEPLAPIAFPSAEGGVDLLVTTLVTRGELEVFVSFAELPDMRRAPYVLTHIAGVDDDGAPASQSTHIPLCGGETEVYIAVRVVDQNAVRVDLDVSPDTPHSKSCATLQPGQHDTVTLGTGDIVAFTPNATLPTDNQILFLSLSSPSSSPLTSLYASYSLDNPPFAPGFLAGSRSGIFSIESNTTCLAQCGGASYYDLHKGPSCLVLQFDSAVEFASSFVAVWSEAEADQDVVVSFRIVDASDFCLGEAGELEVSESLQRRVLEGWLFGSPALLTVVCCVTVFYKQKRPQITDEEAKLVEDTRRKSMALVGGVIKLGRVDEEEPNNVDNAML